LEKLRDASVVVFPSLRSGEPVLQKYSPDFDEWLDLEDNEEIETKDQKIKVVLEINPLVSSFARFDLICNC
jgi:hypothetical protein